jgi:CubicO group peptidase (beta-lactamase class C family)
VALGSGASVNVTSPWPLTTRARWRTRRPSRTAPPPVPKTAAFARRVRGAEAGEGVGVEVGEGVAVTVARGRGVALGRGAAVCVRVGPAAG